MTITPHRLNDGSYAFWYDPDSPAGEWTHVPLTVDVPGDARSIAYPHPWMTAEATGK